MDLRAAVEHTLSLLRARQGAEEVYVAPEKALHLRLEPHWRDRLPECGLGWVAEEALGIAVLCALRAETPREAIIAAANHNGDTDSTAAIAGRIVGTA
jgi:ADP-ribosylglycohydrolase